MRELCASGLAERVRAAINAQDFRKVLDVTVGVAVYDQDTRPCDVAAEVAFVHKTGWVDTTGTFPVLYTEKHGKLGPAIDKIVTDLRG